MRAALAAALVLLAIPAAAQAAPQLTAIGSFDQPVHVAGEGDRVYVVERPGRVQVLVGGTRASAPFLDITGTVEDAGAEQGLLSIAFAPDYAASGLFYVFYTGAGGVLTVDEGIRSAGDPNRGTLRRNVFTVPHPDADNHNGGQLAFGPDGLLYAGTGDGGSQGDPGDDAQRMDSLLGKILRVDPRSGAAPEIWALGLRNPWRFSFDPPTGNLLIGDVGGGVNEEIDVGPPGVGLRNYGWVRCEGAQPACPAGTVPPALNLPHADGYSGVIGGFVVRDPGLPSLLGRYLFADLTKNTLLSAALGAETTPRAEPSLPIGGATSLGVDACSRLYVASLDGPVYRIHDGTPSPCPPGSGPPPAPVADTTPCRVVVAGAGRAQRILRRGKRLALRLRAAEACTVALRARRFRAKRVALAAGVARTVRLAPTKPGLRKLRRAKARSRVHRVRVTVRITAVDGAGNRRVSQVRRRVR